MITSLKSSLYNHIFNCENNAIIFNARTLAIAQFEQNEFNEVLEALNKPDGNKRKTELYKFLIKNAFLLPAKTDELKILQRLLNRGRNDKNHLSIVIAPTLGCNFNCAYCFEGTHSRAKMGAMSLETQDKIVDFINDNFKKHIPKTFNVTWFGGEPLLAVPVIQKLSERFIKMCSEYNVRYNAILVSNGYNLRPDIVDSFCKLKIKLIQITIDGPAKIHDQRRILKNGGKTYERIIENIKYAAPRIPIVLRVNVDADNQNVLKDLIDDLKQRSIYDLVSINLGHVTKNQENNSKYANVINKEHFAGIDNTFVQNLKNNKTEKTTLPDLRFHYCGADHKNTFMIGPNGESYACTENFGNESSTIGSINANPKANKKYIKNYLKFDPTKHPKCKNCKLLPLCMGGCAMQRLANNGEPSCDEHKLNIKNTIVSFVQNNLV